MEQLRTIFLIDGFNLYHSVRDVSIELGGLNTKWLNISSLCKSFIPRICHDQGFRIKIEKTFYFSAFAEHRLHKDPHVVERHEKYIQCLESTGIERSMGRFKRRDVFCDYCKRILKKHEEKESDVSLSVRLIEIFLMNECDLAMIVSGDTDLLPAIQSAKRLKPDKKIGILFPYRRATNDLLELSDFHYNINPRKYRIHQFTDPVELPDGTKIYKPEIWKNLLCSLCGKPLPTQDYSIPEDDTEMMFVKMLKTGRQTVIHKDCVRGNERLFRFI